MKSVIYKRLGMLWLIALLCFLLVSWSRDSTLAQTNKSSSREQPKDAWVEILPSEIKVRLIVENYDVTTHYDKGGNATVRGTFRVGKLLIEGQEIELIESPLVKVSDEEMDYFLSTKLYGRIKVRFRRQFLKTVWMTQDQKEVFLKLKKQGVPNE